MRIYITSLTRTGVIDKAGTAETFGLLDKPTIGYSGNRLSWVNPSTDALLFEGMTGLGRNASDMQVTYDDAGRMRSDETRGIETIDYDNDGHPVRIVFGSGYEQQDVWDGFGNHISTIYYKPDASGKAERVSVKSYTGEGHVMVGGEVVMSHFPGGYFSDGGAHYYVNDYQGNVIAVLSAIGMIEQRTAYYPYGEPWHEPSGQSYLFSGNERLRVDGLNEYDFNARRYNPVLGSFTTWDALNEQYPWLSPYAYCGGNPIRFIDPSGNRIVVWENGGEWELRYENEEYNFFNVSNQSTGYWNNAFMVEVMKGVDELVKGDVGKLLIDGLIQSEETITIQALEEGEKRGSSFNFNNGILKWDYNDMNGGPTINININNYNLQERPIFVGLGHELAHAFDYVYGNKDMSTWFVRSNGETVLKCDIFAGNVENAIRLEHFLPYRKTYDNSQFGGSLHINGYYNLSPYMYSHTRKYLKSLIK